jgi:amidohydrolase
MRWITSDIEREMVAIRHDLHRHPELSWQEYRTADKVCQVLERQGISYQAGIAGVGVVADIPGMTDGPVIALRADMDALPVQEDTGLSFASETPGVMHACGHDGHTSILLGVAAALARAGPPPLPVRLLFQPAEEVAAGARAMIREESLKDVAMIFGAHIDCNHPVGKVVVNEGVVSASRDVFRIEITGRGGHAARPQEAIDAIVIGASLAQELHQLTGGTITPENPAVVSIGCFQAGTAPNVIAGTAVLEGTIYARDETVRNGLKQVIRKTAMAVTQQHRGEVQIQMEDGIPAIINRPEMAQLARSVARTALGEDCLVDSPATNMGAEDFSCFLEHTAGCYIRIGAWNMAANTAPAHSSQFDFDEGALVVGAEYLTSLAIAAGKQVLERGF